MTDDDLDAVHQVPIRAIVAWDHAAHHRSKNDQWTFCTAVWELPTGHASPPGRPRRVSDLATSKRNHHARPRCPR